MPVGRGDLGAVGPLVHLRQGMDDPPESGAHEVEDGMGHGVEQPRLVRNVPRLTGGPECVPDHQEQRYGFERTEKSADPVPVLRCADEIVVMSRPEDAGEEHEADLDVHPLLQHLALGADGLHQHEGEQRAGDHFPGAFHPEVDDPPPPELVLDHVLRVVHARQVHKRQEQKAEKQHALDAGPLLGLHHGHEHVEQEQQHRDHDQHIGPAGRLDVFAALIQELRTHDRNVRLWIQAHPNVAEHDQRDCADRRPELG